MLSNAESKGGSGNVHHPPVSTSCRSNRDAVAQVLGAGCVLVLVWSK